ncbi:MAG: hypothetical protein R3B90_12965 [Planctomycetaceae bacterium]
MRLLSATCLSLLTVAAGAAEPLLAPGSGPRLGRSDFLSYQATDTLPALPSRPLPRQPLLLERASPPAPQATLSPIPEPYGLPPIDGHGHGVVIDGDEYLPLPNGPVFAPHGHPVTLYHDVKVFDAKRIRPNAVPQFIAVPNPNRGECAPVFVEVCMPVDCPPDVKIDRKGQRLIFDFGKHRVRIVSLRGKVRIDYDG